MVGAFVGLSCCCDRYFLVLSLFIHLFTYFDVFDGDYFVSPLPTWCLGEILD